MATGFWCPFATAHTRPDIMCNLPTLLKSSVQNLSIGGSAIFERFVFQLFQKSEKITTVNKNSNTIDIMIIPRFDGSLQIISKPKNLILINSDFLIRFYYLYSINSVEF